MGSPIKKQAFKKLMHSFDGIFKAADQAFEEVGEVLKEMASPESTCEVHNDDEDTKIYIRLKDKSAIPYLENAIKDLKNGKETVLKLKLKE
jgi:hypothetical protein